MKNIVKKIGALVLVWVVCLATLSPAYAAKADLPELPKIGRASCRERV